MSSEIQGPVVDEGASHPVAKAIRQVRHNLVAYLALFIAIGGTAMAAKPLITGADIEDDSVTGADVLESSLGTVPSATDAVNASSAESANYATFAETAANADNASLLENQPASAFATAVAESFHNVGAAGEPPFLNGWVNSGIAGATVTAFYKDPWGVVHLKGSPHHPAGEPSTIFVLPEGYRPAEMWTYTSPANGANGPLFIRINGEVQINATSVNDVPLDGITFRAAAE